MPKNHSLKRYRQAAAAYMKRARRTRDPVLRRALFSVAGLFQEKASRRENDLAQRGPGSAEAGPMPPAADQVLDSFHGRTDDYWRRALATRDPVLQGVLSALAGLFQEMAARREHALAKQRAASEAPGAARERRLQGVLSRTPSLRRSSRK